MSVWITGDIHGEPNRLSMKNFYVQKEFSENQDDDVVIIAGDFGLVWDVDGESKSEKYNLDWLENHNFTTVFVDGNHENHTRLATYPVTMWHGGKVHVIRPHVLHLMRGEIYNIDGKTFFAFGGASSHDISDGILDYNDPEWKEKARELNEECRYMYRVKGLSWWAEELPSPEEMDNGVRNLASAGNKVDFMITHSPSTSELYLMGEKRLYKPDILTNYLENLKATTDYRRHIFGHMHVNQAINDKDICLYEQIIRIV